MKRKKVNPNRVPIKSSALDVHALTDKITRDVTFRVWLDFMAALAGFADTTQQMMLDLWERVNSCSALVSKHHAVQQVLADIEAISGIHFEFKPVTTPKHNTKSELQKLEHQLQRNAVAAGFALIGGPIIYGNYYDKETTSRLFFKAFSYDKDIVSGKLKAEDIQAMLMDEYDISIEKTETGSSLDTNPVPESKSLFAKAT